MKELTPPFRLGRKKKRIILDANGLEVMDLGRAIYLADEILKLLNSKTKDNRDV